MAGDTLLQRSVDNDVLARAFGAMDGLMLLTVGLGAIVAPALIDLMGVETASIVVGALLPALALLSWRALSRMDAETAVRARELEPLRGVPIFAPLAAADSGIAGGAAEKRQVKAGETVFRKGDHGDAFYVVGDGTLSLSLDGTTPRPLGPGDFFGEIALLRDVPRTATITAETDAELLSLTRDDFLPVVTGHAGDGRRRGRRRPAGHVARTRAALARLCGSEPLSPRKIAPLDVVWWSWSTSSRTRSSPASATPRRSGTPEPGRRHEVSSGPARSLLNPSAQSARRRGPAATN